MNIDLHTHTSASDGALSPTVLVQRAREMGVDTLSITDHDTVAAYDELPEHTPIRIVPGIELSTRWETLGIHVLGLNVDLKSKALGTAVRHQTRARQRRAERIGRKLERIGADAPLEGARRIAGHDSVGRPHFAAYLVESGLVADHAEAFDRYLGQGKIGDVREQWATMPQVIDWIVAAGGVAVLAHPIHYRLTATRLKRLLKDFMDAGGRGLEVVSGQQNRDVTQHLGRLSRDLGLLASCGSDFHRPGRSWSEVGRCDSLPRECRPVWEHW